MQINLPSDCGNAPRIAIVGDLVSDWATGDSNAVAEWLADDATWLWVGQQTYSGPGAAAEVRLQLVPEQMEVISIITHGRLAACDGFLTDGSTRIDFSHMFRFASTSKTAKIKEARTYCIES